MKVIVATTQHTTHRVCAECLEKTPELKAKNYHGHKGRPCCFCGRNRPDNLLAGLTDGTLKTDCFSEYKPDPRTDPDEENQRKPKQEITIDLEDPVTEDPTPKADGTRLEDMVEIVPDEEEARKHDSTADRRKYIQELRVFAEAALKGENPIDPRWKAMKGHPKMKFGTASGHPDNGQEGAFWVGRKPSLTHIPMVVSVIVDRQTEKMLCMAVRWRCRDTTPFGALTDLPALHICKDCYISLERETAENDAEKK